MNRYVTPVAVAVVAGIAGFLVFKHVVDGRRNGGASEIGTVSQEQSGQAELATGTPATLPEFVLTDRAGEARSIKSWPGRSLIINFWATWCAPCRREIPLLNAIHQQHSKEGFQVVGIAVDFREDVLKYADEIGIEYPLLIGEQDALEAVGKFGLAGPGFPFTVFTDDRERIVMTHLGEITPAESKVLLQAVRDVNSGTRTIAEARAVASKQLAALQSAQS